MPVNRSNDPPPGPKAQALDKLIWLLEHPDRREEMAALDGAARNLPQSNLGVKGSVSRDEIYDYLG